MDNKEPLHEIILRQLYLDNPKQPVLLSTDDILWKLDDPAISGSNVKECMEWCVHQRFMEKDLGKYKLDRFKFLELKEQYEHLLEEEQPKESVTKVINNRIFTRTPKSPKARKTTVISKQKAEEAPTTGTPFVLKGIMAILMILLLGGQSYYSYHFYLQTTSVPEKITVADEEEKTEETPKTTVPWVNPNTATNKGLARALNAQRKQNELLLGELQVLKDELVMTKSESDLYAQKSEVKTGQIEALIPLLFGFMAVSTLFGVLLFWGLVRW